VQRVGCDDRTDNVDVRQKPWQHWHLVGLRIDVDLSQDQAGTVT